jgi:OsmC-like protein
MKTYGSASWKGGLKDGAGSISTRSGAVQAYPYGFASRFEGKPGTNPEELIGAAHAGCFTMALSLILGEAQLTAAQMDTRRKLRLPLKALVWQDASGSTWLSYDDPSWLAKRHGLAREVETTVGAMAAALNAMARTATTSQ